MNSEFAFYYGLFKKRMPVMSVIVLMCAALGIAAAVTLPPRFAADATLLVEGAQIPTILAQSTVQTEASEQLQIIEQRLMTRANLIDIARKFQVFDGQTGLTPDDIVEGMRKQTRVDLSSGRDRATIMTISFTALSPKVAADVVNEFVTVVLAEDAKRRLGTAGETLEFFERDVQRLSSLLSQRSAEIVTFKEANQDALPEGLDYRLDRQSTLQERLNLAARQIASLRDQSDRLKALGSASSIDSRSISPDRQQLAAARANLSADLATLSENHPRIKNHRAKVALLEARIDGTAPEDTSLSGSTTATVLQLQLAEIDSEMNFLKEESKRTNADLLQLRQAIERTPQVSIRLEELEREYENTQLLYNEAAASRAKAQTGEQIEFSSKGERISVIEQAAVPNGPTSPNRKLIAGGGIFAGAALASVFFALTELMNRTIRRPIDLMRGLGVQPLATIPYIELPGDRKKRHYTNSFVVVLIIVSIIVALWTIHTQYLPLDLLFDRLVERLGLK